MTQDLTSIGIGVDSTQLNSGAKALDNFSTSAKGAASASQQFNSATKASASELSQYQIKVMAALQAQHGMTEAQAAATLGIKVQTAAMKDYSLVAAAVNASSSSIVGSNEKIKISTLAIREPIVLVREAMRGDFSRMAGSATLLAQAFGLLTASTLPFIAVVGGIALVIGGATAAVINYHQYLSVLTESTLGLGRATGLTADQLGDLSKKISDGTNYSTQSVAKMQQELIRMGDTDAFVFDGIIQHLQDYVAITGEKAPQALSELGKAFNDPIQGYLEITEKAGGFNLKTYEQIEQAQRAGDDLKARSILMQALADSTNGAATAVGGLNFKWQEFLKGAGNFVLGLGSGLFHNSTDSQRASAYSGFGYNPINDNTRQDQARAQAAAQANAEQERNNVLNRQALDTFNQLAPKHVEINKLLQQEAIIRKSMATPGGLTQAQGNEALGEAQLKINALNKQLAGPHVPQQHEYTTLAQELDLYNTKLNQENSLYGIFDSAQANAIQKTNQEVDAIEKKKDAKNHLIDIDAKTISQMLTLQEIAQHNQDVDKQGISIYDDLNKSANDYLDTLQAIEVGLANGSFTPSQAKAAQNSAQDKYNTATDPLYQTNRTLDEQIKLYSTLGPERDIQKRLDDEEYSAMQKKQPLSAAEIVALHEKLELVEQLNLLDVQQTALLNQSYSQQQRNLNIQLQALNAMHQQKDATGQLIVSSQQYQVQLAHIVQLQLELSAQKSGGWTGSMAAGLHRLVDTGKTASQQLTDTFGTFFSSVEDGIANSIGAAVTGTEDWGQAIKQVATSALSTLIAALVKMGEQWLLQQALGTASQAAATAAGVAQGAALAAAYAPAATAASIASFGAADVAGIAGMTAAYSTGATLALLARAEGGPVYGPGGPKDDKVLIAASNGEYVINADATSRNRSLLDYINGGGNPSNRHFASGGMVGPKAANDQQAPTYYIDYSGANFGGADPDTIMQRVDMAIRQVYGPQIVRSSVQLSLKTSAKLNGRQTLNPYVSKAG